MNIQYPEFSDSVIARYTKRCVHAVAGLRLNPHDESQRITFLLQSKEDNYTPATKTLRFLYETDVIELYSDREVRLFEQLNRDAIQAGLLVPYDAETPAIDRTNALNDADLDRLARTPQRGTFETRINAITSIAQLKTLRSMLSETAPIWKQTILDRRISALE